MEAENDRVAEKDYLDLLDISAEVGEEEDNQFFPIKTHWAPWLTLLQLPLDHRILFLHLEKVQAMYSTFNLLVNVQIN